MRWWGLPREPRSETPSAPAASAGTRLKHRMAQRLSGGYTFFAASPHTNDKCELTHRFCDAADMQNINGIFAASQGRSNGRGWGGAPVAASSASCKRRRCPSDTWLDSASAAVPTRLALSLSEATTAALAPPAACRCSASPPANVAWTCDPALTRLLHVHGQSHTMCTLFRNHAEHTPYVSPFRIKRQRYGAASSNGRTLGRLACTWENMV